MTAGSVIAGGFRLIRRDPGAVAIWCGLQLLFGIAAFLIYRPFWTAQVTTLGSGAPAAFNPAMISALFLSNLLIGLLWVVLYAAAFRAVLQPERRGFAYLRFGIEELLLLALTILFVIIFYVAMLVLVVGIAILAAFVAAAAGTAAVALSFSIVPIILVVLCVFVGVRLSLAGPLSFMRRNIIIGESWRLTRGHFWPLFGADLAIWILLLIPAIPLFWVTAGPIIEMLRHSPRDPQAVQAYWHSQMQVIYGQIGARQIAGWILSAIFGGLAVALFGGALASATRQLLPEDVAEPFR